MADKPLMIVSDAELATELDRMAAAAGCELAAVVDVAHGRRAWPAAPLVLLDGAALADCVSAGLTRRAGVVVLCRGEPPPALWSQALQIGAEKVLTMPLAEDWLVGRLADAANGADGGGRVIATVGGRGGAGASVFAAALALIAVQRGDRALLVDCDPLGGGLDLLLGVEQVEGLRWPDLAVSGGRISAGALHGALPAVPAVPALAVKGATLTVLSCGQSGIMPDAAAVAAVLDSGCRAGDTVVCDLPRQLPAAALAAVDRADLVALVVPAEVRACAAAAPIARRLLDRGCPVSTIVRGPAPGGLAPADVARALSVPLLTTMRPAPRLAAALEAGRLPVQSRHGPLARSAAAVLDAVGQRR